MPYNESWLMDGTANRIILAVLVRYNVVSSLEETIYISNKGFITDNSDAYFTPIISTKNLQFNESISINGGISTSYGDVEINNPNGEYDNWLDSTAYIWVNRSIKLYYGDISWKLDTIVNISNVFQLIFDGLIEDIDSKDRSVLNFKVRDKMERLNYPVTENKLLSTYGTWASNNTNENSTLGMVFGEVHNITPLQVDPSTLEYFIGGVEIYDIIEIRDNGVPIHSNITTPTITGATVSLNTTLVGTTCKLLAPLVGTCTVSLQGINKAIDLSSGLDYVTSTYVNDIASLIAYITCRTGHSTLRLNSQTELDLTNFNNFKTNNTAPVGLFINDNTSVLSACQLLANSIGAQVYFTRTGKLQLLQLGVYTSDPVVNIDNNDILHHSLKISGKTEVQAAVSLGYCKNWTVQKGLETGIPQEHKDMYAKEWLVYTVSDSSVKTTYKLTADPIQKNTLLISSSDATNEATRLHNYYKQPHIVYSFIGTPRLQILKLGQKVNITHNRFGLQAGKDGQVVSLSPNWSTGQVTVGVII